MTIWRVRITCWIPKVSNTPSEYVILFAFLLQHWLHERASMLRYTYIACLVRLCCKCERLNSLLIQLIILAVFYHSVNLISQSNAHFIQTKNQPASRSVSQSVSRSVLLTESYNVEIGIVLYSSPNLKTE